MNYGAMKRDRDPDRREVMKKFTFKGVLDKLDIRTSGPKPTKADQEIQETLRPENFQVKRVSELKQIQTSLLLFVYIFWSKFSR